MLDRPMIPALRIKNKYSVRGSRYTFMYFDKGAVRTVKALARSMFAYGVEAEFVMVPENYGSIYQMDLD